MEKIKFILFRERTGTYWEYPIAFDSTNTSPEVIKYLIKTAFEDLQDKFLSSSPHTI